MRINVGEIQKGCILSADVFSKTNRPIIPKKTVLTDLHIRVLKAFSVNEIEVEKILAGGIPFDGYDLDEDEVDEKKVTSHVGYADLFLRSVYKYKKEFISWQSGLSVDIGKIRDLLIPLLEKMDDFTSEIFNLYRYSTKETYQYQHPVAVGILSGFIGKKLNLDRGEWMQLALAGCLADSGMAKINHELFQKTTSLTEQEFREVKKHPIHSYKMVQNTPLLRREVKIAILEHHERLNGSGYPLGEKEEKISKYARIISIADIYHAMTCERTYRSKQSPYKVLEFIQEGCFGEFDITILKTLISSMVDYSTGDKIRLSDGRVAEILFVDEKTPTRPLIKLLETNEIIQLTKYRQLFIESVLT